MEGGGWGLKGMCSVVFKGVHERNHFGLCLRIKGGPLPFPIPLISMSIYCCIQLVSYLKTFLARNLCTEYVFSFSFDCILLALVSPQDKKV